MCRLGRLYYARYKFVAKKKTQNEAARIVTGLMRSVSIVNLYRECDWVTLEGSRKQQKFIFMYKSVNGLVPSYIYELIPPLISEITDYPLRNQNNITVPLSRTETTKNIMYSFIYYIMKLARCRIT